jgi:ribonuclease-3 family protein
MLVCDANRPVGKLHKLSVNWVKAEAQSKGMRAILPLLTEKETEVFKRGRNAHTSHTPKNQSGCDYHYATGFEALVGYLYLKDETERLSLLLNEVIKAIEVDESEKASL